MNIFRNIEEINNNKNSVITVGTFDGVHLGHHKILDTLIEKSIQCNSRNFVVTFEPHPRTVVNNGSGVGLLTTLDEKIDLFKEVGIENLLVVNFTKEFSQTSYGSFIVKYFVNGIGASHIVIGYDHKFGKDRDGNEEYLHKYGEQHKYGVTTVPPLSLEGDNVSSTKIRKALLNGEVKKAAEYLGRNYSLIGKVVEGVQRGRVIGFPTANIVPLYIYKLIPNNGVYLVKCRVDGEEYYGLMNIGNRPTFEDTMDVHLEVHILDFNRNIYGKSVKIDFVKRIREETKFESADELIKQINIDKETALNFVTKLISFG